jgi:hypothetical protein
MTDKAKQARVEGQRDDKRRERKVSQVRRRIVERAGKAARRRRPARP